MIESFEVVLVPHEVKQKVKNVTVTKSLQQDQVYIVTTDGRQLWGYCPTDEKRGGFLPLSGFPKELVPEVQKQINHLRGYKAGEGPEPPVILETGRTAQEQRQDSESNEDEDGEIYE